MGKSIVIVILIIIANNLPKINVIWQHHKEDRYAVAHHLWNQHLIKIIAFAMMPIFLIVVQFVLNINVFFLIEKLIQTIYLNYMTLQTSKILTTNMCKAQLSFWAEWIVTLLKAAGRMYQNYPMTWILSIYKMIWRVVIISHVMEIHVASLLL